MNFRQVHLDFHTSEAIPEIGSKFSKKQFQEMLTEGHVNSITVFSKCHHGWAYHPSKANVMHPGLSFDLLGAQIEAAHEIGVKTPVYISAGLDEKIAREHSGWLIRNKDESTTWVKTFMQAGYHRFCFNSPYLDILLEQIKEVAKNYDADGIFLDICGVAPCYCQNCMTTLIKEGKDITDDSAVAALAERVHLSYAQKVREAIDSVKPGLPVFHNGGHIIRGRREFALVNSHLELESLPTGGWGYDHFPLSAAYARTLGLDFLGMTGKFHTSWGEFGGYKHKNALRYEVSLCAANGAKSSVGDQPAPNGKMDMATYKLIGAAYAELEQKEPWLENAENLADIALLSYEAVTSANCANQSAKTNSIDAGAVRILLEGKYLFDVIDTQADFSKYKVIILPDMITLPQSLKDLLNKFLKGGGKLLASGTSCIDTDEFAFDFGAKYIGENPYKPDYCRPLFDIPDMDAAAYIFYSQGQKIELLGGSELAARENPYFNRSVEHFSSHYHAPNSEVYGGPGMTMGKDGIYIAWQIFSEYAERGSLILKKVVFHALDTLLQSKKTLNTNLPAQGVATLTHQPEQHRYIAHLLYASPVKRGNGIEVIEDIIPIRNTEVCVKASEKIKSVTLAPQMKAIDFEYKDGAVTFTVDEFECHQMIALNY